MPRYCLRWRNAALRQRVSWRKVACEARVREVSANSCGVAEAHGRGAVCAGVGDEVLLPVGVGEVISRTLGIEIQRLGGRREEAHHVGGGDDDCR